MSRLPPPDRENWNQAVRRILGDRSPVMPDDEPAQAEGAPPNILFTIAHHPALLEPFLAFSATLALEGTLARRDAELLALRAAWNCRSAFEWGHHVLYAQAHGLSDKEITQISRDVDVAELSERDKLFLSAADQLHVRQQIDDDTWGALADKLDPAQLVELPFVVGTYTMLSMVANAAGVPLEPGLPVLPSG